MTEEIPIFSISSDELEANDYIEPFYVCDVCNDKHEVKFAESENKCSSFRLGFYNCKGKLYLYSIGEKQIRSSKAYNA